MNFMCLFIFLNKLIIYLVIIYSLIYSVQSSEDAKRLLDDLLTDYDHLVRPVEKPSDYIKLHLGIKLSQIADIDERNQIMTTNVWVRHEWHDYKLRWNPALYGNITKINIPSSRIWLADIILYNNADGDYQITTKTKATVYYDGKVIWEPPMIYKSYCAINIEYYPFDIQECYMKFGSWTHDGNMINLEHLSENNSNRVENASIKKDGPTKLYTVDSGIDMSDYYPSVEWDVLSVPAQKNIKYYLCCPEPYYDIYFNITIRRKTLFYTVNLIIPCVNISFLSVLVFFLPSDSGEKLTLGISILVALLVFYLLLIELIPPTSIVIPLIGKYLLFTLILVNLSILLTIFILNLHHRKPNTHKMPNWMKKLFINILPKMLMIERPLEQAKKYSVSYEAILANRNKITHSQSCHMKQSTSKSYSFNDCEEKSKKVYPPNVKNALDGIKYINSRMEKDNQDRKEIDDWKYASMVIDRLMLWIFTAACLIGTFGILLQAPSIYDQRKPLVQDDHSKKYL